MKNKPETFAKVIDRKHAHSFKLGEIVYIETDNGGDFTCSNSDNCIWYLKDKELEPVYGPYVFRSSDDFIQTLLNETTSLAPSTTIICHVKLSNGCFVPIARVYLDSLSKLGEFTGRFFEEPTCTGRFFLDESKTIVYIELH